MIQQNKTELDKKHLDLQGRSLWIDYLFVVEEINIMQTIFKIE